MPEISVGYSSEAVNRKLSEWGFASKYFDNVTGRLDVNRYVTEVLKPNLSPDGKDLGELRIPVELQTVLTDEQKRKNLNVALISAIMGFGHLRPARAMEMLLLTLDIKCEHICFGDGTDKGEAQKLENSLRAVNVNYIRSSISEAVEQKILDPKEGAQVLENVKEVPDVMTKLLDTIHTLDKKMYHDIVSGKPSTKVDAKKTMQLLHILKKIYAGNLIKFVEAKNFSHLINFYPLLNMTLADIYPTEPHRKLAVLTDSVANPAGWGPFVYQIAEREEMRDKIGEYWGNQYKASVIRSGGFPAPIAGLARVAELSDKRRRGLQAGQPLTIYLPASQVTTTQQGAFKEILEGCRPLLEANKVRILVQTGTGDLGRILYGALNQFLNNNNFSENSRNNVLLHWAPDSLNVIDLFEVISGSEMPLCVGVKGSEMTRMTAMLNLPHIAVGAIGYQEFWNIIISTIQRAPIIILPKAKQAVMDFIKNAPEFDEEKKRHYLDRIDEAAIDAEESLENVLSQAYDRARDRIGRGSAGMPYAQRDMMLKTLAFLFSGKWGVFSEPTGLV